MIKPADKAPLVSVIMPAYNAAPFIDRAINSVLMQTVDLELIIINDCSPDDSHHIIAKHLCDSRVKYIINAENMGAAASRNKGVSLSKGKYIAYLDSDDWWEEEKLEKQIRLLENSDAVICCTARELVSPDGILTGRIISVNSHITYKMLLHHNSINCSSVLLLKSVAAEFPMEHEDAHEDYITWLKILKKYKYALGIDKPFLKYRITDNSKSGSKWNSAKMTFKVYRYMNFSLIRSIYYFILYTFNGIKKYWT